MSNPLNDMINEERALARAMADLDVHTDIKEVLIEIMDFWDEPGNNQFDVRQKIHELIEYYD